MQRRWPFFLSLAACLVVAAFLIVPMVLSILATLGLVAGVWVVRRTEDIASTLIAALARISAEKAASVRPSSRIATTER